MGTRTDGEARPARRPLLILAAGRPRGSRVRARLTAEAERRAMMVAVLKPADRGRAIDLIVEATHPDAVIVCGDAPVQAAAAAVAAARDLPYACMPAGPGDLLARDLGMALDDPAEALKLPFSTAERTIDLGEVNGLPFVNRVAVGVELPAMPALGARRRPAPMGAGPKATHPRAGEDALPAVLVCNNRFEMLDDGLGLRDWPASGRLQVLTFEPQGSDRSFAALRGAGFQEQVCARFQLALRAERGRRRRRRASQARPAPALPLGLRGAARAGTVDRGALRRGGCRARTTPKSSPSIRVNPNRVVRARARHTGAPACARL